MPLVPLSPHGFVTAVHHNACLSCPSRFALSLVVELGSTLKSMSGQHAHLSPLMQPVLMLSSPCQYLGEYRQGPCGGGFEPCLYRIFGSQCASCMPLIFAESWYAQDSLHSLANLYVCTCCSLFTCAQSQSLHTTTNCSSILAFMCVHP